MKLCYNLNTSMNAPLEENIKALQASKFDACEINFTMAQDYLKDHSMEELTALIKDSGLKVLTLNAIFETSFATEEEWERIEKEFDFVCELGTAFDCHAVVVLSGDRVNLKKPVTKEEIYEDSVKVLNRLADRGMATGMNIGYEPVGDMIVGDIGSTWDIVRRVNRPEVGLVPDDFNLYLYDLNADVEKIREIDPEKITIVHINDAENIPFTFIDQNHRCMPGDGRIDVISYMKAVKATGYDGYVSVEILSPELWKKSAAELIAEAYEKTSAILEQI